MKNVEIYNVTSLLGDEELQFLFDKWQYLNEKVVINVSLTKTPM